MMTFKTVLLLAGELIHFQWDLNVTVHLNDKKMIPWN